jgi:methylenetetrahydrofolate dehydrogenase (NADP+)/methenyltetrahydrofolate cyclohydrolase
MRKKIAEDALSLREAGWVPRLVSICVGDVQASQVYVRNQKKAAASCNIDFEERTYEDGIGADELQGIVMGLNCDPRVTGIIIQRPLPEQISVRDMQRAVHPLKDVEGMHPASIGNIVYNDLVMGPCTAVAALEMLRRTNLRLEGLDVVVVGHSAIVGKPVAFLLMAEGATVTVCHHMTRNLAFHSRQADAVVVGVGRPGLIQGNMIKPGAALIDVGINEIEVDNVKKVVGDADFATCSEVAGWITPVPGGVGPVTVSVLLKNSVTAANLQRKHYEHGFSAS